MSRRRPPSTTPDQPQPLAPLRQRQLALFALLPALLPALFAVWLYWPVIDGGLLSDDLALMSYLVEPGKDGLDVLWRRVADDFAGPWAFGNLNYYRPIVTLTIALELWAGRGAEWVFHVSCILQFGLTVFSCAVLTGKLAGRAAALPGALLLAAHPAGHEPICWICTRADFLVLIAGAWACIAFVDYLRHGKMRHLLLTMLASMVALLCKEPAVLLAVWFVLLDFVVRGRSVSLWSRLLPHLQLAVLWIAYLGLRWQLFGVVFGDAIQPVHDSSLSMWLCMQANKLSACVAPVGSPLPATAALTVGLLTGWVLVLGWRWPANRRFIVLGVAWLFVGLLPVQWQVVGEELMGNRFVLTSVFGLSLAVGPVLGGGHGPRWFRWIGLLMLVMAAAALATGSRARQAVYVDAWTQMDALREQLDDVGRTSTVERPLVLLFAVHEVPNVPFLGPAMLFPIAETPIASADHAFVAMGFNFEGTPGKWLLVGDPGPLRSMWQQGATLCYWPARHPPATLAVVPPPDASAPIELIAGDDGAFFARGGPASPWPVVAVNVASDARFDGGELTWFTPEGSGGSGHRPIGPGTQSGAQWFATVDLGEDFEFLMQGIRNEGIAGFRAELTESGAPTGKATTMHVVTPKPRPPLSKPLRGTSVSMAELANRLPWSDLPAGAEPDSRSVVLLNGWCSLRLDLSNGRLVTPLDLDVLTSELRRWIHVDRMYYYLECRHQGSIWRSAIDWFVLDVGPRLEGNRRG